MSGTTRDRSTLVTDVAAHPVYYDDDDGTYRTWCAATDTEPVSTALFMAVSAVRGVDPTDLEPLSAHVDPDALNAVVVGWYEDESRARDGSITFPFARCTVTVRATGEIVIDPDRSRGDSARP